MKSLQGDVDDKSFQVKFLHPRKVWKGGNNFSSNIFQPSISMGEHSKSPKMEEFT
jgi:hypothetical protein